MADTTLQPLDVLVGRQLSSVTFVMDYVQLDFDGAQLTTVTVPVVEVGGSRFTWDTPGYRDRLCERIAEKVRSAEVKQGEDLRIEFESSASVTVSLRPEDYRTAEAALFRVDSELWVW